MILRHRERRMVKDNGRKTEEINTERQEIKEESKEIEEMTKAELQELAKEKEVPAYYQMNKAELIEALKE